MPTAKALHCAAVVGGTILVAGSVSGGTSDAKLEALTTAGWTGAPSSAPTPGPTYASCGTECWVTRNSLPVASTNGGQACAAVGSLVYMYEADIPPAVDVEGFHKYDSATDTWATGGRPVPVRTTTTTSRHTRTHTRASTQPRTCGCRGCRHAVQMLSGITP